jgi:hypothetical protein
MKASKFSARICVHGFPNLINFSSFVAGVNHAISPCLELGAREHASGVRFKTRICDLCSHIVKEKEEKISSTLRKTGEPDLIWKRIGPPSVQAYFDLLDHI